MPLRKKGKTPFLPFFLVVGVVQSWWHAIVAHSHALCQVSTLLQDVQLDKVVVLAVLRYPERRRKRK